jgi:enoyl-CoA hydratase/carnithine racemase
MERQLIEEISDGVATLRFNRPDRLDALLTPIVEGLLEALPRGGASSSRALRHAHHLAGRAQSLQDPRKPMQTDPSTI